MLISVSSEEVSSPARVAGSDGMQDSWEWWQSRSRINLEVYSQAGLQQAIAMPKPLSP